jgi:hypothetical protein
VQGLGCSNSHACAGGGLRCRVSSETLSFSAAIGHAIACGKVLLKVKAKVGHGGWEALFGGSNRTFDEHGNVRFAFTSKQGRLYMKVARFPALGRQAVLEDDSERFNLDRHRC